MTTQNRGSIAKVVSASLIGTTIEWYDFFLYTSAAALVFGKLFFPGNDPLTGTLLAFLTYAVGFLARPVGGLVFGHFGDRVGRKKLLVLSLLLMGGSTCAMGVLPTYAAVGVLAPILLTLLRLVQGFALGGEWGGAVLIVSEHGDDERRGFWASWPQCGAPGGNLLATAVLAVLAATQSDEAFLSWGWRLPFLLSGVLVVIGLWIRLAVSESPVFLAAQKNHKTTQAPVVEVFRKSWRAVLITIGSRMAENVSYYVITAFILVYVTTGLSLPKSAGLNAVLIGSAVHFVTIPLWGILSDRIGRRPVYLFGAIGMAVWSFVFFAMLDTKNSGVIILAATVGLVLHGAMYGPQAAFFSEQFPTRVRYTGLSVGGQLSSIAAGAVAPLVAVALFREFGSTIPVSLYVVAMCVLTVIALLAARETKGESLHSEVLPERGHVPA
ncbi:MFS transporter [Amycolatopsis regifaucium]|uniref:Putative proline/betaine transporter n=1 Tax=Amycolatopsis regifaucium TaxID=546365 RepID=A0A154MFV0_9PSEU|nr:MFS transporter [Amycolatopsis regifaucium]KZB83296.1 MFS transporter [Amycolatopsis regifaucium]OKA08760.1 MFS transporter [Amycolatopsis regifaucium]SFI96270.1 metabolite-proton symporter [Amycolatopsis regifaucium]